MTVVESRLPQLGQRLELPNGMVFEVTEVDPVADGWCIGGMCLQTGEWDLLHVDQEYKILRKKQMVIKERIKCEL